jgi:5-methylcytosine-specific restriction protein A
MLRRRVINEEMLCRVCDDALATEADHITPMSQGGAPYSRANVQGLCHDCHARKTRAEQLATSGVGWPD